MLQNGSDSILSLTPEPRAVSPSESHPQLARSSPTWRPYTSMALLGRSHHSTMVNTTKGRARPGLLTYLHRVHSAPPVSFIRTVPQACTRAFQKPPRRFSSITLYFPPEVALPHKRKQTEPGFAFLAAVTLFSFSIFIY